MNEELFKESSAHLNSWKNLIDAVPLDSATSTSGGHVQYWDITLQIENSRVCSVLL